MTSSHPHIPETDALEQGLAAVFKRHNLGGKVSVLRRQLNVRTSSFASEIVACRIGGDSEMKIFCKYGAADSGSGHGHRGGVPYEADVYAQLLQHSPLSKPIFYGAHTDLYSGDVWLILEFLENSMHVNRGEQPESIMRAARWIGEFHAAQAFSVHDAALAFLHRYDRDYYLGWAKRTLILAETLHEHAPWLIQICEHYSDSIMALCAAPPTVIHGEYTVQNVLLCDSKIYPVDWESAAIGAGEIDLACLTDRWPEIAAQCEHAYRQARWPEGAPADFHRRLDMARLYIQLRWLGDNLKASEKNRWRYGELRATGQGLGILT